MIGELYSGEFEAMEHNGRMDALEQEQGMTRKEAIGNLNMIRVAFIDTVTAEQGKLIDDTFRMAIKALEQEPCEDAISREAVLDLCDSKDPEYKVVHFKEDVECLPPVNPQPKIGHWITKDGREQGYDIAGVKTWYIQIMCSECGFIETAIEGHTGQYHYCSCCGAKMVESQEGEG